MSNTANTRRRTRRLNRPAVAVLVALLVLSAPALWTVKLLRDRLGAGKLLTEARTQVGKGNPGLAVGYLNRYLGLVPDDVDALDLKSKILFETARDPTQAMEALKVHGQMIAVRPQDPRWEQARRRMVRLNLNIGRWRSALAVAEKLTGDDAEAHRLRARAWASVGVSENNVPATDKAREEYEAAEAREPGDVDSAEDLARIYRERQEKPEKALKVLDKVVADSRPAKKRHAAALLARARHYDAVKDAEKAAADVEAAVRDDPDGLMPRLIAAEVALQRHQNDAARLHIAAIAPEHRNDLKVKNLEGLIDLAESRPDDAIRVWRAGLMQIGGTNAAMTWQLAHVLLETGRVTEAEPLLAQYRRLVGGDEPDPKYTYLSALALLNSNRPSEAAAKFESIRYKVPKTLEANLLLSLGRAYESIRDPSRAMDAYRLAAERSQKWAPPWKALARLQAQTNPSEALATLQKGLTLSPDDPELLTARAEALYNQELARPPDQRSLSEVERLLAQASKSAPGSVDVAIAQAEFYANNRRFDDALSLLRTAADLSPKAPAIWIARANLLSNLGRLGEAQEVLDLATREAGPQAIFYVSRARVLARQGQLSSARKVLAGALERVAREQKPQIWKSLGEFYEGLKDYASADAAYRSWADLQPDNPEPRFAVFQTAMLRNDDQAASRALDDLKSVSGGRSYFWRVARVEELTRVRRPVPDPAGEARRLEEATRLIEEIESNDPQLALGYLLEGRVSERKEDPKKAIDAYRKALERGGGQEALTPLVALLSREKRDAEVQQLRDAYPAFATSIEQLAAVQAIAAGDKSRAEDLARKAVEGDPQGFNTRQWEIQVFEALGKPQEAEVAARKWVGEKPAEVTPWLMLLMLQVKSNDKAAAARTVEQIRQNVKTDRPELLLAQCYRAAGDERRAAESFREAVRRWPDDTNVLAAAVPFYEQVGLRQEAEYALRLLRRRDPSNAWSRRKLALSLASHGNDRAAWDEALALVGPEATSNDVPDDQMIRAAVYSQGPDPEHPQRAVEILEGLLAELPNRTDIHDQIARVLLRIGEPQRARDHAAKVAESQAATPESILFYAGLLLDLKDTAAAEAQLERLQRIQADGLPVVELKARVLAAKGQSVEAAGVLGKAYDGLAATPDGPTVGEKMVQILVSIQQPDEAERIARRVAETLPRGRGLLAEVLALRGKPDDAARQLEDLAKGGDPASASDFALKLAAQPNADARWTGLADRFRAEASRVPGVKPSLQALEQLAMLRHLQRQYAEEVDVYRKMLDLKPANLLFLNNMAWTLSEELHQPEEALKVIDGLIEKVGRQPHILDTRGVIYTRLGKLDSAVKDLKAAAKNLRDPSVDFHLARAYFKMGNTEEARTFRERAVKAGLGRERLQQSERADWDAVMNP